MGNFSRKIRKALLLFPPPGPPGARRPRRPGTGSARTMTGGGGKVRQPAGRSRSCFGGTWGSPGASSLPEPPGPPLPKHSVLHAPQHRNGQGRALAPWSIRPRAARRAGPPTAGLTPGAPRPGRAQRGRGRREGAPEGTAATVMALNSCPSGAAAEPELRRPPPPPRVGHRALPGPTEGPAGTLPQPTHALGPKTLGTPERPRCGAGAPPNAARLGRDVALRGARFHSPRPPLPLPTRRDAPSAARAASSFSGAYLCAARSRLLPSRLHTRARQCAGRVR